MTLHQICKEENKKLMREVDVFIYYKADRKTSKTAQLTFKKLLSGNKSKCLHSKAAWNKSKRHHFTIQWVDTRTAHIWGLSRDSLHKPIQTQGIVDVQLIMGKEKNTVHSEMSKELLQWSTTTPSYLKHLTPRCPHHSLTAAVAGLHSTWNCWWEGGMTRLYEKGAASTLRSDGKSLH